MINGFIFDIDGTLIFDGEPLPGAIEVVRKLKAKNKVLRFATNGTGKSPEAIASSLNSIGFDIQASEVETSVSACIRLLQREYVGKKGRFILPERTKVLFDDFKSYEAQPDYIVLGDLDNEFEYPLLNSIFQQMRAGAQLIVFHRNTFYRYDQQYHLDSGAFTMALENAAGQEAIVTGKPSKIFFNEIQQSMGLPKNEILIVGDDLLTDIQGAQNANMNACLVKTGKYAARPPEIIPQGVRVIETLSELLESE